MSPYVNEDYRDWLRAFFAQQKARSGLKSQLAQALGVKTSYLSQVLSNTAHFTAEQALLAGRFFGFTDDETEYFVCCVQKERTQDESLRQFLSSRIFKMRASHLPQRTGIAPSSLELQLFSQSLPMQSIYEYLQFKTELSEEELYTQIQFERPETSLAIENLEKMQLIKRANGRIRILGVLPKGLLIAEPMRLRSCREESLKRLSSQQMNPGCSSQFKVYSTASQKELQKIIAENWAALSSAKPHMVLVNIDLIPVASASTEP